MVEKKGNSKDAEGATLACNFSGNFPSSFIFSQEFFITKTLNCHCDSYMVPKLT